MADFQPGTALVDELDKKLLIMLRDGRKLIGILRSFDQFANLVVEEAYERIIVGEVFGDIPLGLYVIRGENVVLLGQIDPAREEPAGLRRVSEADIKQAQKAEKAEGDMAKTMLKRMDFLEDF